MLTNDQIKNILLKIEEIRIKGLIGFYNDYIRSYSNSDQASSLQLKNNIFTLNSLIDYNTYSEEELDFFKQLHIYHYVGAVGNQEFDKLIATYSLEKSTLISRLEKKINSIQIIFDGIRYMNNIFEFFPEGIIENQLKDEIEDDMGLINIHFQNECNITGLEELSKHSDIWNKLIKQLYELDGENPESNIKFKEIKKGSLIITLGLGIHLLTKLGKLISWVLDQQKKYCEIQLLKKQLANFDDVFTPELKKTINEQIENKITSIEEKIAENVLEKMKEDKTFKSLEGKPEQEVKSLKLVLTQLVDFLDKGGEVKVQTNETTEEEKELVALFKETKERIEYIKAPKFLTYCDDEKEKE